MKRLLAVLLFVPAMAHAEFFSGNTLLARLNGDSLDRVQALGYIQGISDAYVRVIFCPPENVTAGQLSDMIRNYLTNNPATRHKTADALIAEAFGQVWPCAKRGNNL
jgi:hypothetical protein